MNSKPLKNERNRVHDKEGESENGSPAAPADEKRVKEESRGRGDRTPQYRDTREEMERGREGKNGGKGHWTMSFRGGY